MATQKPRITVTLEPHVYEVLTTLSELQGSPRARIISELLESVTPVFERTCYVLQMAQKAKSGVNDDIRESLVRSEAKIQAMMDDAMGQFDIFAESLSDPSTGADESERKAGRAAPPESGSATTLPPHSNTGVTPKPRRKTPKKTTTKRNR